MNMQLIKRTRAGEAWPNRKSCSLSPGKLALVRYLLTPDYSVIFRKSCKLLTGHKIELKAVVNVLQILRVLGMLPENRCCSLIILSGEV